MAINTEDRRRSVVGIFPVADGTISGVDKQHVAGFYRGIAAATPTVIVTPQCRIISILSEDRTTNILSENRTVNIPVENRTVTVTCQ